MENGTNLEIEFYTLDLKNSRNMIDNDFYVVAYKSDDFEETGIMIDFITGTKFYPATKQFEPLLTYKSYRLSKLIELYGVNNIVQDEKKGADYLMNKYKENMRLLRYNTEATYRQYSKTYDQMADYILTRKIED